MMPRLFQRQTGWDIIGDVHGHATQLGMLLSAMGYKKSAGVWRHPERRTLFLGDYINRGPEIRAAVDMVRAMVEDGRAVALIGNHEHHALIAAANTERLIPKFERQLAGTRAAYKKYQREWQTALEFFLRLPLCHDKGGFRAVHACWSPRAIQTIGIRRRLRVADLVPSDTPRARAIHLLLNGPEITAPPRIVPGKTTRTYRVQWWRADHPTWSDAGYPVHNDLPHRPIAESERKSFQPYGRRQPPVFFGHYGFVKPPRPIADNICCLDLAISRGGALAAYRWDGEQVLTADKIMTQR